MKRLYPVRIRPRRKALWITTSGPGRPTDNRDELALEHDNLVFGYIHVVQSSSSISFAPPPLVARALASVT
jgi:hypothetical protein